MSTSLLSHGFGLEGYDYVRQSFAAGSLIFTIRPKPKLVRCPCCQSFDVIRKGVFERWLRTVPIGFKPVWLLVKVPIIFCRRCGCVRRIDLRIAEPRRWYTRAFERFVQALSESMTMLDSASMLGIDWEGVKEIVRHKLARPYFLSFATSPPLKSASVRGTST